MTLGIRWCSDAGRASIPRDKKNNTFREPKRKKGSLIALFQINTVLLVR